MEIHTDIKNGICFCRLKGRLDGTTSGEAETSLLVLLENESDKSFVLELQELDYLSSAGLRVFLIVAKKAKSLSTSLHLCAPANNVQEVLHISGFTSILPLHANREAAEKALEAS